MERGCVRRGPAAARRAVSRPEQAPGWNVANPLESCHELPVLLQSGMDPFLQAAIQEARKGLGEGGIPIGSILVCDGRIIGRGHNQRVQKGSVIYHAEMN